MRDDTGSRTGKNVMEIFSDVAAAIEEQDEIVKKQQEQIRRLENDIVQLLELIEEGKGNEV